MIENNLPQGKDRIDMIRFWGHPNVGASNRATLEVTKDTYLTPRGDCIIGIRSDKAAVDLNSELKKSLQKNARITIEIQVGVWSAKGFAWGHEALALTDKRSLVLRKSNYTCSRTLAIRSNLAAADLPRQMVQVLRNPKTMGKMVVSVEDVA